MDDLIKKHLQDILTAVEEIKTFTAISALDVPLNGI